MSQPNILFICMDSLRYDNYRKANTPNFDSVGKPQRLHSQSCWTIPSIIGYLFSRPPIGVKGELFQSNDRTATHFIPEYYGKRGYVTSFLTSNAFIELCDDKMSRGISKWFTHWRILKYLDGRHHSTSQIITDAVDIVKETDKPVFMFLLLMDTHTPYYDGTTIYDRSPSSPSENMSAQVRAVSYIDGLIKPLLGAFKDKGKTVVYVTSDHGEDDKHGHDPMKQAEYTDKLFEIPYVKGVI